jgi:hypothetical protein
MKIGEFNDEHPTGKDCDRCWSGYPIPCTNKDCSGFIHAVFGDEDWDGYWLFTKCDTCGESE